VTGLVVVHAAATLILVGLILTVQFVHYPLFARVGAERFGGYQSAHTRRIGPIVMPLMLIELATAVLIAWHVPPGWTPAAAWTGLALVGAIWATTALASVPAHRALAEGWNAQAHARLVGTNWIRTLAWLGRGALVAWTLVRSLS
jgi:hypothetical protein